MLAIDCMEEGTMVIDWNPEKYKTKAGAAKGLYKALCKWCKDVGYNPDIEVRIDSPEQQRLEVTVGFGAWASRQGHLSKRCMRHCRCRIVSGATVSLTTVLIYSL